MRPEIVLAAAPIVLFYTHNRAIDCQQVRLDLKLIQGDNDRVLEPTLKVQESKRTSKDSVSATLLLVKTRPRDFSSIN